MPLLVLLWLALLGVAPSAIAASSVAVQAVAATPARGGHRGPEEQLRAPAIATLATARPAGHVTPVAPERHAPPFAHASRALRPDDATGAARGALERYLGHVVVARGGHLPYFPTAPPLQG